MFPQLEYTPFIGDLYCVDCTDGEILEADPALYIDKGYRPIDIELYGTVASVDLGQIRKLLKAGANPNVNIRLDEDGEAFNAHSITSMEESHLMIELESLMMGHGKRCSIIEVQQFASLALQSKINRLFEDCKND